MIRKIIPLLMITLLCCSCQRKSFYQHSKALPASGWKQNLPINFRDSLPSDVPDSMHFVITLRHTNLYPYQNIWLYVQVKSSDGTTRTDSIDWRLAETNGRWFGKGWGSLYNISCRLPDLKIKRTGTKRWFEIKIQHGLRDEILEGVEDIGIRLYSDQQIDHSDLSPLQPVGIQTQENKK